MQKAERESGQRDGTQAALPRRQEVQACPGRHAGRQHPHQKIEEIETAKHQPKANKARCPYN
jgi:hypothetical protein